VDDLNSAGTVSSGVYRGICGLLVVVCFDVAGFAEVDTYVLQPQVLRIGRTAERIKDLFSTAVYCFAIVFENDRDFIINEFYVFKFCMRVDGYATFFKNVFQDP